VYEGFKLVLNTVKAASTDNLVTKLQEIEFEDWVDMIKELM